MAVNKLITAYNDAGFAITATATPNTQVTVRQGKYVPVSTATYITTQSNDRVITQSNDYLIAQGL